MFQTDLVNQKQLFSFSYKEMLPVDSDVFLYCDLFDQIEVEEFSAWYSSQGQESKHPRLMLRTIFYGLTHGIVSGRKLENACQYDVRFIVLSGAGMPNRRTFDRFLQRHEEHLNNIFVQIIEIAMKMDLVKLGRLSFDGSHIKGYTSQSKTIQYEKMGRAVSAIEKELKALKEDLKKENAKELVIDERLQDEMQDKKLRLEKIKTAKAQLEKEHKEKPTRKTKEDGTPNDDAKKSLNDPEAIALDKKNKNFMVGYNVQAAVEESNQIIVAADIHDSATDYEALPKMLDEVKENCGSFPDQALADNGYNSTTNISEVSKRGVEPIIAVEGYKPDKIKSDAEVGKISLCEQVELKEDGRFYCLAGKKLSENSRRNGNVEFRFKPDFCKNCPFATTCVTFNKKSASVPLNDFKRESVAKMYKNSRTEEFKKAYSNRMKTIEPVFGNIKYNKGLKIFIKGKNRVKVWWRMVCTAHNIEKIIKCGIPIPSFNAA